MPADLFLRNDDLAGLRVVGVGNGVVEQADRADHLADLLRFVCSVRGVAVDLNHQSLLITLSLFMDGQIFALNLKIYLTNFSKPWKKLCL